jgi:cell division septum initiation protein DivIVA
VDVNAKIDELIEIVEAARAMPMSSSCVINRSQVLDLLDDLKRGMPEEIDHARQVIAKRESMVEDGRREAERIKERTRTERDSIIGNTDVSREARGSAERIMSQARHEAEQIRAEADEYVDQKLANFEVVLTKTLQAVGRGRDKMRGSHNPMEELGRHVDEQDLVAEERRRSRDFSGPEERERDGVRERERETDQFDGYESQEFTTAAFAEADRVYEQHSYEDDPYASHHTGEFAAPVAQHPGQLPQQGGGYPAEQHDGYGYEQGAYDQGAAQGYGTGEFTLEPQYAEQGGYPEQGGYGEQVPYGDPAAYGQPQGYAQPQPQPGPGAQYPADETSYFDTGLIDVRQFQHDGYGR